MSFNMIFQGRYKEKENKENKEGRKTKRKKERFFNYVGTKSIL